MKRSIMTIIILFSTALFILPSCSKNFLDANPSTTFVIPSTLADVEAILDNDVVFAATPMLTVFSADNYYIRFPYYNGLDEIKRNAYIWAEDIFGSTGEIPDWQQPYEQVYYANIALESLQDISSKDDTPTWNRLKGSALFLRANAFYHISQLFAPPYDAATASKDSGIPLRLKADVSETSVRSTVQETYDQVIKDLQEAISLLPPEVPPVFRNRPSRPAALALLARVYLAMNRFEEAGAYADSCLQLKKELLDYNLLNIVFPLPFTRQHTELLYQNYIVSGMLLAYVAEQVLVDSNLYRMYASGDLRKDLFFRLNTEGLPIVKSSYSGYTFLFTGPATDEMYLVRAECLARAGDIEQALSWLNKLLVNRYKPGNFNLATATTKEEAIRLVLEERRKELAFRGLRWTDVRRFNKLDSSITFTRNLNGEAFSLPANDPRIVLPIPPDVIKRSGMQQNPR